MKGEIAIKRWTDEEERVPEEARKATSFRDLTEFFKKFYGGAKETVKEAKDWVKKKIGGGVVYNKTDEEIAVAGEGVDGVYKVVRIRPGGNTKGLLADADAIVILPGQKFRLPGGISETVSSGAIKILDWSKEAVVTKGKIGFDVTAVKKSFKDERSAKDVGWSIED